MLALLEKSAYNAAARQTEADLDRVIHYSHRRVVEMPHLLLEPLLVEGSYLLEEYHAVLGKSYIGCGYIYVRRELGLAHSRCDRGGYHRRAVSVSYIVLHYKHGS